MQILFLTFLTFLFNDKTVSNKFHTYNSKVLSNEKGEKRRKKRKERGENRLRNEYVNNNCTLIHVRER